MANHRHIPSGRTPTEIAKGMTPDERLVFLSYDFIDEEAPAPMMSIDGGRTMHQGSILSRLATRDGLFTKRYDKVRGVTVYRQTETAMKVLLVFHNNLDIRAGMPVLQQRQAIEYAERIWNEKACIMTNPCAELDVRDMTPEQIAMANEPSVPIDLKMPRRKNDMSELRGVLGEIN